MILNAEIESETDNFDNVPLATSGDIDYQGRLQSAEETCHAASTESSEGVNQM
jgi:hypothetical protein